MAGDIEQAKQKIRELAYNKGMCVTVTKTDYIYTAGEQSGFIVGLIQYPRFEILECELESRLCVLAEALAERCCQKSFTVCFPKHSIYFQRD